MYNSHEHLSTFLGARYVVRETRPSKRPPVHPSAPRHDTPRNASPRYDTLCVAAPCPPPPHCHSTLPPLHPTRDPDVAAAALACVVTVVTPPRLQPDVLSASPQSNGALSAKLLALAQGWSD